MESGKMTNRASVIVSVYKNCAALAVLLESLRRQSFKEFDIVISEDGESEAMSNFVSEYNWFCPYQHITQHDDGWRKNRSLNRAIVAAKSDWLIFVDGDCVLHRRFVEMHIHYASDNTVLVGRRVKLSPRLSNRLIDNVKLLDKLPLIMLAHLIFKSGCRYPDEGLFVPPMGGSELRSVNKLTGCNMSFSRNSIMLINGFNEDYKLPAIGEDVDLVWRFKAVGCQFVSVRNRALMYHLFHHENWTSQKENAAIMERERMSNNFFCENGLNRYL